MTKLSLFNTALKDFDKYFVGFDEQFNRLAKMQDDMTKSVGAFPFYNIKKSGENRYTIELALAGWSRSEIELELDGDRLVIKGNVADDQDDLSDYFFKGISKRAFTRTFMLNDQVEVNGATFVNGVLAILLERIIPESKKPKKIEIDESPKRDTRQFLTES